ncbi:MAG TPA: SDR family oxidoreductase [Planctomycetota bacterium]
MKVLVTGGTRGIGAAVARAFEAEGAKVAVSSRSAGIRGDVAVDGDRIVAQAAKALGGLDVLVACAGVADPRLWNLAPDAITAELWDLAAKTDLWGTFACARAAAKRMSRGGAIVTVTSIPALVGDSDGLVYAAAKGGVLALTKMLAVKLAPKIRVNCVAFGSIETGWADWLSPAQKKTYAAAIPVGRFGRPEEAAEAVVFLAKNTFTTGQTLVLDGGETLA